MMMFHYISNNNGLSEADADDAADAGADDTADELMSR